ncbi:thioredoxin domain-containing protein [Candidatus Woesebacteria bacterium]|nr:MAG: thioredoxin domain-containing protein [Candidatus Woesebacteria bacterium]
MAFEKTNQLGVEKLLPVFVVISVFLAFAVGVLWNKVSYLENGTPTSKTVTPTANGAAADAVANQPKNGKLTEDQAAKLTPVNDKDHVRGNKNAKVFLVEYSDLQCPYCSSFHPTTTQILEEYGDKVALVYRHFPLDQIHPQARPAAVASECIADLGGQDAYWKFLDAVFADQKGSLADMSSIAVKAGVSKVAFQTCIDSGKFDSAVEEDYQSGLTVGITGTPGSLVVNEKGEVWLVPGALPFAQLKTTIDEALAS